MIVHCIDAEAFPVTALDRDVEGLDVGIDGLGPFAERHVDVRDHVLGMGRGRRDLRVHPRRAQTQGRVHGIVIRVDHVMGGARMAGVGVKDLFRHGARPHVGAEVAHALGGSENRQ